jgi:hypothetical protein
LRCAVSLNGKNLKIKRELKMSNDVALCKWQIMISDLGIKRNYIYKGRKMKPLIDLWHF